MAASINYIKSSDGTGNANTATVQNPRVAPATTIEVDTVTGIPTYFCGTMGTPHTFSDPVTGEDITVISEATAVDFKGHVDGSNLEIDEIAPGYTDGGSAVGDIVIVRPTTQWSNNVAEVLEVEHNQDGTHSDITAATIVVADGGTLDVDTINEATAANGVAIDGMTIKDGKVVGGSAVGVANSSLDTTAGELGGAWTTWTHSFAGFTGGSETVAAKYTQIGKTVHFRLTATLGANPSAVTNFTFNLPVTANSAHAANTAINGGSTAKDATGGIVPMVAYFQNATSMFVRAIDSSTAYNTIATPSTVIPFAWASGDILTVSGTYEAA